MSEEEYLRNLLFILHQLPEHDRQDFITSFSLRSKNPVFALALGVFLGSFGVDRFYLGHIWLGLAKLLTVGGFGVWTFIDWFLIARATRLYNIERARHMIGHSF